MQKFGWLVILFFSFNVYSYEGEEIHSQCEVESVDAQVLDAVVEMSKLLNNTRRDLMSCFASSLGRLAVVLKRDNLDVNVGGYFTQIKQCSKKKLQDSSQQICEVKQNIHLKAQSYVTQVCDGHSEKVQNGIEVMEDLIASFTTDFLNWMSHLRDDSQDESQNPSPENDYEEMISSTYSHC